MTTKIRYKRNRQSTGMWIVSILFAIYSISLMIPLVWGIMVSVQEVNVFRKNMLAFPKNPQWRNYIDSFVLMEQKTGFNALFMLFNSLWFSLGGTLVQIFTCVASAYACSRYKTYLGRIMYWSAIIALMIPVLGNLPASLKVCKMMGMYDTPLSIISSASALGTPFIVSYAFFKGVSWEYAESAFIDGSGHTRVFFQIMLPMASAPVTALLLTNFIGRWSGPIGPLLYLPSWPTLASGFYIFQEVMERNIAGQGQNYPQLFAGLYLVSVPIFVLYGVFNKTLMNLQIGGGLKG